MTANRYRVLVGINYPSKDGDGERRAEPDDVVDDLPDDSVPWLLKDGAIEEVDG